MSIWYNLGPLSVTYYELDTEGKIKILSSLYETTMTAQQLHESVICLLIQRSPSNACDHLVEDFDQLEKYIQELDRQFSEENDKAVLVLYNKQKIEIKKKDIIDILEPYVNQTIKFMNAILDEQNLTLNKQIVRFNYCTTCFTFLTGHLLGVKLTNLHKDQLLYGEKEIHSLSSIVSLADKLANERIYDFVENTLGCSIGVGEYRGVFVKQLLRGSMLPCSNSIILNTVIDYQKCCLIEIYQGERPLSRYCNLVGRLSIKNLPPEKAYKIEIQVILTIDKDETLEVQAFELKSNKSLTVAIEKGQISVNNVNMVLDAIDNKEPDQKLIENLDKASYMIESIRNKFEETEHEEIIFEKMNEFVTWLTDRKRTIDLPQVEQCISSIEKYLEYENLNLF